jgi:zinc transporter 1/2/3
MMGSLFLLFIVEMWLNAKTGGHTHGSATGAEFAGGPPPPGVAAAFNNPIRRVESFDSQKTMMAQRDEKRGWDEQTNPVDNFPFPAKSSSDELEVISEMPPWFIVFYEQYVRQRDEMLVIVNRAMPALPNYQQQTPPQESATVSYFDDDVEKAVDPMVLKKQSMQITLIEGGILFHSVFVGMTVSITSKGFVILLIAIVFHQAFEGLGLGSRIAAVPYPAKSWAGHWSLHAKLLRSQLRIWTNHCWRLQRNLFWSTHLRCAC